MDMLAVASVTISSYTAQILLNIALFQKSPSRIVPLTYVQVIASLVFDTTIFHHIPTSLSLCGSALVLLSTYKIIQHKE